MTTAASTKVAAEIRLVAAFEIALAYTIASSSSRKMAMSAEVSTIHFGRPFCS